MPKRIKDVVQDLLENEDAPLPQNVSNRLLLGTIIEVRHELKKDINGNTSRIGQNSRGINANSRAITDGQKSDKKWAALAVFLASAITAAVAAFG